VARAKPPREKEGERERENGSQGKIRGSRASWQAGSGRGREGERERENGRQNRARGPGREGDRQRDNGRQNRRVQVGVALRLKRPQIFVSTRSRLNVATAFGRC
jgi:hypothetical protein